MNPTSILAQFLLTTRQNGVIEEIQNTNQLFIFVIESAWKQDGVIEEIQNTNQQHRIKEENHENHQ